MKFSSLRSLVLTALFLPCRGTGSLLAQAHPGSKTSFKSDFSGGKVAAGYPQVLPGMVYSPGRGHGFFPGASLTAGSRGGQDALRSDFVTADKPFFFTVDLPDGH